MAQTEDEVRAAPERARTHVAGRLEAVYEDDFARPERSRARFFLQEPERGGGEPGARFELALRGRAPEFFEHGALVRVAGTRIQEQSLEVDLTAGGAEPSAELVEVAPAVVSGEQRVLVLVGNSADQVVPCSNASIQTLMFGTGTSVDTLFRESSSDALRLSGDVFGPFSVPSQSSNTCDTSAWRAALEQAASASGVNVSAYPRRVYVIPQGSCGFAGLGTVGGNPSFSWVTGACGIADVYAHELGHNLGMHHANTPGAAYADHSCTMGIGGIGLRHFNAPHQAQMGWSGGISDLSGSGVTRVGALDTAEPVQVLHLPRATGGDLYISYRLPVGLDATQLPSAYRERVSIHSWAGGSVPTVLLATLAPSQSYFDEVTGATIRFQSADASGAFVEASLGCTARAPTVEITPSSQGGAAGSTRRYVARVSNVDGLACSPRTFALSFQAPQGWTVAFSSAAVTVAPGASASVDVDVSSPATAAGGATSLQVQISDAGVVVASTSLTFVVDAAAPMAPSNLTATLSRREVTLSWSSAADDVGVTGYAVLRDGNRIATVSGTNYGDRSISRGATYVYTVQALDAAGRLSPPSNAVTVLVPERPRKR